MGTTPRVEHLVAHLSPAGTTRTVAAAVAAALRARGAAVRTLDLRGASGSFAGGWPDTSAPRCLWVGSPVYAQHPVPRVMDFLRDAPEGRRGFGVAFVTWGAVSSGLALNDLAAALDARGYAVLGGVKVPAVHSTLWRSAAPLGAGHPDAADLGRVEDLVDGVLRKIAAGGAPLPLTAFDDHPPATRTFAQEASLARAKSRIPPHRVDPTRCTGCGVCRDVCPVDAVELDPDPVFGPACILCHQCVRHCPEAAIPFDAASHEARIRGLAERFSEEPAARVYL